MMICFIAIPMNLFGICGGGMHRNIQSTLVKLNCSKPWSSKQKKKRKFDVIDLVLLPENSEMVKGYMFLKHL